MKLALWFSPALPDELLFISWSQDTNCPKPQENYKVAASHPVLLSPTTSDSQCHRAESRCHSSSVSSLRRRGPCQLSLSGSGCPMGPPLRVNRQREAELLLWSLVVAAHHLSVASDRVPLSKLPWAPPALKAVYDGSASCHVLRVHPDTGKRVPRIAQASAAGLLARERGS